MDYKDFLRSKSQLAGGSGFRPICLPSFLHGFQAALVEWALWKGRAAVFADCGLGKTPIQLVYADNVVRHTNRPALILTPLAVSDQTVREGAKFGVECVRSRDGRFPAGARVVVTNYERLHYLDPSHFGGCVCDESGGIKHFGAARTAAVTEFLRTIPYRLLCTATAAPNDYIELGTSAGALGEMGYQDMLTKFFVKETRKDHLGWGRAKYRMRGHAVRHFWRWICSWARACRRPSDLGFDDGPFVLPSLSPRLTVVRAAARKEGFLFDVAAVTTQEQHEERRRTLGERCEAAASLVAHDRPAVCWCHLNDEGDLLAKLIPGAVQVCGNDDDDSKEEAFGAFTSGQTRVLVTKPTIAAYGLNWQHCAHQTFFPSHSFEQYYQAVRRSWRFGQKNPVVVDVVTSEGEAAVLASLTRKAAQAEVLFTELVSSMNEQLLIDRDDPYTRKPEAPPWLSSSRK